MCKRGILCIDATLFIPVSALSVSGYEGLISARNSEHPLKSVAKVRIILRFTK